MNESFEKQYPSLYGWKGEYITKSFIEENLIDKQRLRDMEKELDDLFWNTEYLSWSEVKVILNRKLKELGL